MPLKREASSWDAICMALLRHIAFKVEIVNKVHLLCVIEFMVIPERPLPRLLSLSAQPMLRRWLMPGLIKRSVPLEHSCRQTARAVVIWLAYRLLTSGHLYPSPPEVAPHTNC